MIWMNAGEAGCRDPLVFYLLGNVSSSQILYFTTNIHIQPTYTEKTLGGFNAFKDKKDQKWHLLHPQSLNKTTKSTFKGKQTEMDANKR